MSKVDISKATPRPWVNDAPACVGKHWPEGGKATVLMARHETAQSCADAALATLAVNSYDLMLASLKELLARDPGLWTPAIERARAAIRIAEGEDTP